MSRLIVIEFMSLDGVMHDPDGSEGSPQGGWAFRYGPENVAGDKFGLGEVLGTGAMLLGRRTWQLFARIWPGRDDPFSAKMNAMPKLVVSRSLEHAAGWQNSAVLQGDLLTEVHKRKQAHDIMVTGSVSVVRTLMAHDLVDEYRLLVFPLVLGAGTRLFPARAWPVTLSGGEAQRAALARALVREPQLMLLDEPFGALDALTRTRMHALLQDLCERHHPAVLLVTHDVDEAILLADRALVLAGGTITLDLPVGLGRPRGRGHPGFIALRSRLLAELGVTEPGRSPIPP